MPERNVELLEKTLQHILDHPEQHDQGEWARSRLDCGTAACFAGWAAILTFGESVINAREGTFAMPAPYDLPRMSESAGALLGLTEPEYYTLFEANNTRDMLRLMVKDLVNGDELQSVEHYRDEVS